MAAQAGNQESLNKLKAIYNDADGTLPGKQFIAKEELHAIYRACHNAQEDVKSEERVKHLSEQNRRMVDEYRC